MTCPRCQSTILTGVDFSTGSRWGRKRSFASCGNCRNTFRGSEPNATREAIFSRTYGGFG